jgi:NAD(P)-dependent dehydrogenase (short-subunit alcohol dehydrogenase family)
MDPWFEGKVELVTGGGDGIGKAAARLFARRGAAVIVTDIRRHAAEATASLIAEDGGRAIARDGDVTDDQTVGAFVKSALAGFGRLDCAFNNAAILLTEDYRWDDETTQRIMAVNLLGVMRCIRHEVPAMLAGGGGTIVNTASLGGFVASRAFALPAYTGSKHGVVGVTKSAALQYARQNIRVNALCPGTTLTAMNEKAAAQSAETRAAMENASPMGRLATPEEMAEAAIWLCSDKSSYVNGHALVVDGGALAE